MDIKFNNLNSNNINVSTSLSAPAFKIDRNKIEVKRTLKVRGDINLYNDSNNKTVEIKNNSSIKASNFDGTCNTNQQMLINY